MAVDSKTQADRKFGPLPSSTWHMQTRERHEIGRDTLSEESYLRFGGSNATALSDCAAKKMRPHEVCAASRVRDARKHAHEHGAEAQVAASPCCFCRRRERPEILCSIR